MPSSIGLQPLRNRSYFFYVETIHNTLCILIALNFPLNYHPGNKGGLISIFLMGCHDQFADRWRTVTKVHGGIDDKRLEELQDELLPNMQKISRDNAKAPKWLDVTRNMTPDFVVKVSVWKIN